MATEVKVARNAILKAVLSATSRSCRVITIKVAAEQYTAHPANKNRNSDSNLAVVCIVDKIVTTIMYKMVHVNGPEKVDTAHANKTVCMVFDGSEKRESEEAFVREAMGR